MLTELQLLALAGTLVAVLFGMLMAVLGWLGNKIYQMLVELSKSMKKMETDMHIRITDLENKVAKMEGRCEVRHGVRS